MTDDPGIVPSEDQPVASATLASSSTSLIRYGGMAAMIAGTALAFAAAILCGGAAGLWFGAVAVGLLFAAAYRTWREAAVLSAIGAVCGSGLLFAGLKMVHAIPTPEAVGDFSAAYGNGVSATAVSFLTRLPINIAAAVVVATAVGLLAGLAIERSPKRKLARVVVASLVVVCTFGAMCSGAMSADMSRLLREPPAAGTFRNDAFIYWRTYLNVVKGEPYFAALLDGAAGDSSIIDGHSIVRGQFTSWALSPASIRLPYAFYLWRYLAPGGGGELLVAGMLIAGIVLAASLWALMPRVGPAAALVPMLLMPYLQVSIVFGGLFMPDAWAALFVTLGFFAWIRERYVVAGALVLAGALCRETAIFALLILLAWALWRALSRERAWVVRAIALGTMTAAFALAYWLHLRAGAPYVANQYSSGGTVAKILTASAGRTLSEKFLNPTEYGAFIYMLLIIPAWLPVALQFPGWYAVLRRRRDALVPVLAYAAFWVVFTVVFGAPSAYWGILYMPLAIAGAAALLAWAGMRGSQASRSGAGVSSAQAAE